MALVFAAPAAATTFTVTRFDDAPDNNVGDDICTTAAPGGCSLRAAVDEANNHSGADEIDLPAGSTSNLSLGTLDISGDLTVKGLSGTRAIVDGAGNSNGTPSFQILENVVTLALDHVQIQNTPGSAVSSYVSAGGQTVNVTDSVIHGNGGGFANGGAIYSDGNLNVTDSTISGNSGSFGGGIYVTGGAVNVKNTLLSGNTATGGGAGAIDLFFDFGAVPSLTVTNSTFSGNAFTGSQTERAAAIGAAIGTVTVNYSTFAENTGAPALVLKQGADEPVHATGHLVGSIIQPGSGASACGVSAPATLDGSYDVVGDNTCSGISNGSNSNETNVSSTDIGLGSLSDNGGKTFTYPLSGTSTAIDQGPADCTPPLTADEDQRGVPRPQGVGCDAGAFEYVVPPDTMFNGGPDEGQHTNDSTPTFQFQGVAQTGGTSIAGLECRLYLTADAPPAFTTCTSSYTPSTLADGDYTFEVRAIDAYGDRDPTPAVRHFTIDTQAPHTSIDSGPNGFTKDSTPTFTFSAPDANEFQCSLDSAPFAPCTSPLTTQELADGPHVFLVQAIDAANNVDTSVPARDFTVDTRSDLALASTALQMDHKGKVAVAFSCPAGEAPPSCTASSIVVKTKKPVKGRSKPHIVTLARSSQALSIPVGTTKSVKLEVSQKNQKLVKQLAPLKVVVTARGGDALGNTAALEKTLKLGA